MAEGEDLARAAIAFLRQEFSAPVVAIVEFAEILREDAQRRGLDGFTPDLDQILEAGKDLRSLLASLLERKTPAFAGAEIDLDAFRMKVRHDLRTPLSAIIGLGELLLLEAEPNEHPEFVNDIAKLLSAAAHLLGQIDTLIDFRERSMATAGGDPTPDARPDLVSRVIESIRSLAVPDTPHRFTSSRILVVDDTDFTAQLLARRLILDGHRVATVDSGRAALDLLRRESFEVVLLDLMMPEMSGFETLCRIKADHGLRELPVIVISALDELDTIVRCIEAGAEDYLPRPFNPVLLESRINACLERKRLRDHDREITELLRAETEHSEALLLNILPKSVVTRLRNGESEIADHYPEVTILFSDIVGFTGMTGRYPPAGVLQMLNRMFTAFDHLALERGLEKIKTIGDAYMVAGGLPEQRADHAVAVADMAVEMIDVVRQESARFDNGLAVRIGIHSGPAIAGIIGRNKFIYDVWGDTVNTASRMESYGQPGRIHISAETRRLIGDAFACGSPRTLDVRGKGVMETYFLESRRP